LRNSVDIGFAGAIGAPWTDAYVRIATPFARQPGNNQNLEKE
jgi:hypothetical protein